MSEYIENKIENDTEKENENFDININLSGLLRIDFIILSEFYYNKINSPVSARTFVSFKFKNPTVSYGKNWIYKRFKKLKKMGFLLKGISNGRFDTYYISDLGVNFFENMIDSKNLEKC